MALVRCPTHKIPYNEENPRGCPACAREKGGDQKTLAQELAKAQQATRKPASGKKASVPASQSARPPSRTSVTARPHPLAVTTTHPKPPTTVEPGPIAKAWQQVRQIPFTLMAGVAIVILVAILVLTSGPRFTAAADPNLVADADLRPLPVDPNQTITVAFAALGTRAPQANPDDASLFRYSYGSDLIIDALNTTIYAITIRVPNRTWHGLRVGLDERRARGELALLGSPEEAGNDGGAPAETHGGYVTYPASDSRPRRTLVVQVRPPNGCYDVTVDLRPQIIGVVDDGNERFYAVAQEGGSPNWVTTQIRIVSRSMRGPYGTGTAC
jgi:hypothetical protein